MHPLSEALQAAAEGRFPSVDGLVETLPPDGWGTHAVVEFTGHALVLTTRSSTEVVERAADGFGGATRPDLLRWLAGPGGVIGSHDAVLVTRGTGTAPAGTCVWAQVAAGNAASLRAFLAAGFVPIAAEVLIHPRGAT